MVWGTGVVYQRLGGIKLNNKIRFLDNRGTFQMEGAQRYSDLYFPIAGDCGLKSSVTPALNGDSKVDQHHFLLQPVSAEELHNNKSGRNFWCYFDDGNYLSLTGKSAKQQSKMFTNEEDEVSVEAGIMWHKVKRTLKEYGLKAEILSFIPIGEQFEVMQVSLQNNSNKPLTFIPIGAIPIYGRSADNLRDHRHVTALLHRSYVGENGIYVRPTLSFDERGHTINQTVYYVMGVEGEGNSPESFYPTVEDFIGQGGSFEVPQAVAQNQGGCPPGTLVDGYESMGGIRFAKTTLSPEEKATYLLFIGIHEDVKEKDFDYTCMEKRVINKYGTIRKIEAAYVSTKAHWTQENNIEIQSGDETFDNYMKWISFQPVLRRIYGCSFLPHHDYGKGGRGWRDLWQDQLALLIMNPENVGTALLHHYGGVRVDGTNATIIGSKPGEFVADRNNITRVWMDHGLWPFLTTNLYIHQTGDLDLLFKNACYFKDKQVARGTKVDSAFEEHDETIQKTKENKVYYGTILEHCLLQNLTAFYEVGEHNHMRLREADWNDALDMASQRGESVAFTAAYAGNLTELAEVLIFLRENRQVEKVELLEEMLPLLTDDKNLYEDRECKNELLKKFCQSIEHFVSGKKQNVSVDEIILSLQHKAQWIKEHIQKTEWLPLGWFNSYYDNHGSAVEGDIDGTIRMMLTGQVFTIMSGTAQKEQIERIVENADKYLYQENRGGYSLNTDFKELKTDLGRMFGFAYGHKENGAVFSHMTTMYGNALYQQGFTREGHKALHALFKHATDVEVSSIYPGIPEYYDKKGKGMYHYLTGAASWYLLTVVTQMFGVRGTFGNLILDPKLMAEQFDVKGEAKISLTFRQHNLTIIYSNIDKADYGEYTITKCQINGENLPFQGVIPATVIENLELEKTHTIYVTLGKKGF